jgi:hypothetical protein
MKRPIIAARLYTIHPINVLPNAELAKLGTLSRADAANTAVGC